MGRLPAPLIDAYPHVTDTEARAARAGFERDLRFGWNITTWAYARSKHSCTGAIAAAEAGA